MLPNSTAYPSKYSPSSNTLVSGSQVAPPPSKEYHLVVWMLSLNRGYLEEEYKAVYTFFKTYQSHIDVGKYNPEDANHFRFMMAQLLPHLMMRERRVPKARWRDNVTPNGKHWIEQTPHGVSFDECLSSSIGYHIAYGNSLCGIAMTQGPQQRVIYIGLGIKQATVDPPGVPVPDYIESLHHKLTPTEISLIPLDEGDEVALRRVCLLLALKEAYIHAIGQPMGFDYSRLEFNVPEGKAWGDNHPLHGWEFRLWTTSLGVIRGPHLVQESYQCASAFFRGSKESTFIWKDENNPLDKWVQFTSVDVLIKILPKLTV